MKLQTTAFLTLSIIATTVTVVKGFAPSTNTVVGGLSTTIQHSNAFRSSVVTTTSTKSSTSITTTSTRRTATTTTTALQEKKEGSNNNNVSNKLLAETIAPFRGLRLFFYGAFASGAFVGGLITASGVAAALNGLRDDITDLNTEYLNLAIDFGAVAFFGICAKLDLDKGAELDASVEEQVQRSKQTKKLSGAMKEREEALKALNVNVRVTEDGGLKMAPLGIMQEKAKQHVILVAGPGRAIRDALRGAQLNKVNFAMTNILVVPYETGVDAAKSAAKPDGSGFGDSRPAYETQPYVAEPVGEGWEEFINAEIDAAVNQAGEKIREEGIALVIANDGKVLRRGVGKVPWRQMVDELEEAVTGEKKEGGVPFLVNFIEE